MPQPTSIQSKVLPIYPNITWTTIQDHIIELIHSLKIQSIPCLPLVHWRNNIKVLTNTPWLHERATKAQYLLPKNPSLHMIRQGIHNRPISRKIITWELKINNLVESSKIDNKWACFQKIQFLLLVLMKFFLKPNILAVLVILGCNKMFKNHPIP